MASIKDVFGLIDILEVPKVTTKNCIVTVASPGYEILLKNLLKSISKNGKCLDVSIVVYLINPTTELRQIIKDFDAYAINCSYDGNLSAWCKALVYSTAQLLPCENIVALDVDTLVIDDLSMLFRILDEQGGIHVCLDVDWLKKYRLGEIFFKMYSGDVNLFNLLNLTAKEKDFSFAVNDGVICSNRNSLNKSYNYIKSKGKFICKAFINQCSIANQYLFNLSLVDNDFHILDSTFNLMFSAMTGFNTIGYREGAEIKVFLGNRKVKILHNAGGDKNAIFITANILTISDKILSKMSPKDELQILLEIIQTSLSTNKFAETFYGTHSSSVGLVKDPCDFSVFMFYLELMRTQGVSKILECGTGSGWSTIIAAAATAEHPDAEIITIDLNNRSTKEAYWFFMPWKWRKNVHQKIGDSVTLMSQMKRNYFDMALLDSSHDANHVYQEFLIATKLVKKHGYIIVHDPFLKGFDVMKATERIKQNGYPVIYHMHPDVGNPKDNGLGLVIIQNSPLVDGDYSRQNIEI